MVTAAMARLQVLLDNAAVQCQDGHTGDGILVNFLLPTLPWAFQSRLSRLLVSSIELHDNLPRNALSVSAGL